MPKAPTPVAVALILCDNVIVEKGTDKVTLFGLFDAFRPARFPSRPSEIKVFASLTDSVGSVTGRLSCVNARNLAEIYRLERTIHFPDRLTIVSTLFHVNELQFTEPGSYLMQLFCDDVYVTERKFQVYRSQE